MTIIYFTKEDDYIGFTPFIQDIANLEAFERELSEQYEFWSYEFDDCVSYLNERKIGQLVDERVYVTDKTIIDNDIDELCKQLKERRGSSITHCSLVGPNRNELETIAERIEEEDYLLGYDSIDDLIFDNADIWAEIGRDLQ
jgi:hypothetical protein